MTSNQEQPEAFYDSIWDSEQATKEEEKILLMRDSAVKHSYLWLGDLSQKKMLEIGCGSGNQALHFTSKGADLTVIDISSKSLNLVSQRLKDNNLKIIPHLMNAESMTFDPEQFDLIYINSVLMHVNQDKVLQECSRVLKKGGKLVVLEPLNYNPFMRLYRLIFSQYQKTKPDYMTLKKYSALSQYFQGYHHKEFYFFAVLFLPVFKIFHDQNQALQWYSRVGKLDQFCFKIIPFLKRLAWVGVAEYVK